MNCSWCINWCKNAQVNFRLFLLWELWGGGGSYILWLGKLGVPPPTLLTLAMPRQALFYKVPPVCFCFVGLSFFPSASWPLSSLSLFLWMSRAFVHGHTFLHSWSGRQRHFVIGLLHGAAFLSDPTLLHYVSFLEPSLSRWNWHLFNPNL